MDVIDSKLDENAKATERFKKEEDQLIKKEERYSF